MIQLTFITAQGPVEVGIGDGEGSLMTAAKFHGVEGLDADCGDRPDPHPEARLSCQLDLADCVDGMIFQVPALQR